MTLLKLKKNEEEKKKNTTSKSVDSNNFLTKSNLKTKSFGFKTTTMFNDLKRDKTANKEISINQKKIHIPKIMTEKYHIENTQSFLPNLPEHLQKKQEKSLMNMTTQNFQTKNYQAKVMQTTSSNLNTETQGCNSVYFNVKDVLKEKTLVNLKKSINQNRLTKSKETNINETNFRSVFQWKKDDEIIDEKLNNVFIKNENLNLIRYLGEKDQITEQFANRFSSVGEDKHDHLNKLCQLFYNNKAKENLFSSILQDKIKLKKKKKYSRNGKCIKSIQ